MSQGPFVYSKYEADNGDVHPVKVQPETLTLSLGGANSAPAAAVTNRLKARVSGGNRAYGVKCRAASFKFTADPSTKGYAEGQLLRLPILSKARFDAIVPGETTGTYQGIAIIAVGVIREAGKL